MNREVQLTLQEAVAEVLQTLTGMELEYNPSLERFRSVTRALNRAMRAVALEAEWGYYASNETVGTTVAGSTKVEVPTKYRPRMVDDDAVRLVGEGEWIRGWAYFLPRDALHKYRGRNGLWVSATRNTLEFSRPFTYGEAGLSIVAPVMREPLMFRLPKEGQEPSRQILNQPIDFDYPDLVVAKAAEMIASTDPLMQPRVQTLESNYKNLMYALVERDKRFTDSPYLNDFALPMEGSLYPSRGLVHPHPHSDERR